MLKIPSLEQAKALIDWAEKSNPGPWVAHSYYVAQAAQNIAAYHPNLDPSAAYILGLLHDIGRQEGVTDMRHVLDGYNFLLSQGYADAARICLTHSFPVQDAAAGAGAWDVSESEYNFVQTTLTNLVYDDYDRLIMVCDSIVLPSGFCLIEKRLLDVALRHGFNPYTLHKWRAYLDIQSRIEREIGRSIYSLLPGVVENTFSARLIDQPTFPTSAR